MYVTTGSYVHYKMQCTTIRYGPYYDYITHRYDVIANRTMQHRNYVTATYITLCNVAFFAAYRSLEESRLMVVSREA